MKVPRNYSAFFGKQKQKYNAKRTCIDGKWFASKKEAGRYQLLRMLEKNGVIFDLKTQQPFKLMINNELVTTYVADFVYRTRAGAQIVEDVKGFKTKEYKIKKKLMKAIYNITIKES